MAWNHLYKPPGGNGKGPAKGAGKGGAAKPFTAGTIPPAHALNHDPEEQAYRKKRLLDKRARREEMETIAVEAFSEMTTLMQGAESEVVRKMAADSIMDRVWGKPVTKNLNVEASVHKSVDVSGLSTEERADLLRKIRRVIKSDGPVIDG